MVCAFVLECAALNTSHLQALLTMESIHLQISTLKREPLLGPPWVRQISLDQLAVARKRVI